MVTNQEILRKINSQEKRIKNLEKLMNAQEEPEEEEHTEEETHEVVKERRSPRLTFTQVITFLGIIGIVIGVISFFLYAVAQHWIGETAQVMLGVLFGFVLFGFAFILHKKREVWSNIVFGGAFLVEYISIGFGVLGYKVIPDYVGLIFTVIFLISSIFLSIHFKSRSIAYLTLVGGYLVPFITGLYEYDLFILSFYTILSLGLVSLSFKDHWPDLRFTSFVILGAVLLFYTDNFSNSSNKTIPLIFLITLFVIYHISSIIGSFKNPAKTMSVLDSISIVGFTVILLTILYIMYDWQTSIYGLFIMVFSMVYLLEIMYFKSAKPDKVSSSTIFSLLGTGIIVLNLGIFFLADIIDKDFLIVIFALEYLIFSIISVKSPERTLYRIFSIASLVLTALMYLIILFGTDSILKSTIMMIVVLCIVFSYFYLFRKEIHFNLNAAAFIIGGFLFIYSLSGYLLLFDMPVKINQIILSILWLIYTLVLFVHVETKSGKWLVGVLLGLTLLKIVLRDLFYLDGAYRIVGFILFGVLLLIGGYWLSKNEK